MASGIINHLRYTINLASNFTLDLNDAKPYPDGSERQYSFAGFTNITNKPSGVASNWTGNLKAFKMGTYICQLLFCYQNYPAQPKIFYRAQTYSSWLYCVGRMVFIRYKYNTTNNSLKSMYILDKNNNYPVYIKTSKKRRRKIKPTFY